MLSFVLPIALEETGGRQWRQRVGGWAERRFRLLLRSFLAFYDLDELDRFLVVTPPHQVGPVRELLAQLTGDARFQVMDERELCSNATLAVGPDGRQDGWYAQQILKLAAARMFNTEFYVTLDSDIICTRQFNTRSLATSGRSYINIETTADYDRIYVPVFARFEKRLKTTRMEAAAQLLNYTRQDAQAGRFYGETPVAFNTQAMRQMAEHLSRTWRVDWAQKLALCKGWTEQSLYFQFLEMTGSLQQRHLESDCNRVLDLERSIWQAARMYKSPNFFTPHGVFKEGGSRGLFVALQSWIDPAAWVDSTGFADRGGFYRALEEQLGMAAALVVAGAV